MARLNGASAASLAASGLGVAIATAGLHISSLADNPSYLEIRGFEFFWLIIVALPIYCARFPRQAGARESEV
jgi:hypothetical protein